MTFKYSYSHIHIYIMTFKYSYSDIHIYIMIFRYSYSDIHIYIMTFKNSDIHIYIMIFRYSDKLTKYTPLTFLSSPGHLNKSTRAFFCLCLVHLSFSKVTLDSSSGPKFLLKDQESDSVIDHRLEKRLGLGQSNVLSPLNSHSTSMPVALNCFRRGFTLIRLGLTFDIGRVSRMALTKIFLNDLDVFEYVGLNRSKYVIILFKCEYVSINIYMLNMNIYTI